MDVETVNVRGELSIEYDDQRDVYRVNHDWESERSLSTSVVMGVAAILELDPVELDPLYEQMDGDALDALFTDEEVRRGTAVAFRYEGIWVTIHEDGDVELRENLAEN